MADGITGEQNRRISEILSSEQARLRRFIRKNVLNDGDAEDILQEVFYELVETYRLMEPIERVGAWLFRVARNRIIDLFRRKRAATLESGSFDDQGFSRHWQEFLPSPEKGPEAAYAHNVLIEELTAAIEELPREQREVFIAHEIDGKSFREISDATGLGINTLLSRKRYAVMRLRERLQAIHEEFRD